MALLTLTYGLLCLAYLALQWRYRRSWLRALQRPASARPPAGRISVVVAARNEARHLPPLLERLLNQTVVPDAIWIVDDHSEDETAALLRRPADARIHYLLNPGQGKRAALDAGIRKAGDGIILLTDGDCLPEPGWVAGMAAQLADGHSRWVSGPVLVLERPDLLSRYDALESGGMMAITGAGFEAGRPELAQGASIGFSRKDFLALGGYSGLAERASGDDVLLLERFRRAFPGQLRFVADARALVYTHAPEGWAELLRQRLRWASKSAALTQPGARPHLLLVYATSLLTLGLPLFLYAAEPSERLLLTLALLTKIGADAAILEAGARLNSRRHLLRLLLPASLIHPLLVVLAGTLGPLQRQYRWKGRKVY